MVGFFPAGRALFFGGPAGGLGQDRPEPGAEIQPSIRARLQQRERRVPSFWAVKVGDAVKMLEPEKC